MTLIFLKIISFAKDHILEIVLATAFVLYSYWIYDYGYDKAEKKHLEVIAESIKRLEEKSQDIALATEKAKVDTASKIDDILVEVSKKPANKYTTTVKYYDSKTGTEKVDCIQTPEFKEDINKIIDEANKK